MNLSELDSVAAETASVYMDPELGEKRTWNGSLCEDGTHLMLDV